MSGTTGALGHNVAVHASPGEVLSHFHIGLMGNVEACRRPPCDAIRFHLGQTSSRITVFPRNRI